jgi:hypothetical protein
MKTGRNAERATDHGSIGSLIGGLSIVVALYTASIVFLMAYIGSTI